MPGEYDIDGGNTHRRTLTSDGNGKNGVDDHGIAWVSGQGGIRLVDPFLLEVAGITPQVQGVGMPTDTDWLLV